MLFVFLSKKLISTDTICPVLIEIKNKTPSKRIILFTLDKGTIDEIRKNSVLNHFIDNQTKIIQIGGSKKRFPLNYLQRFNWIIILSFVFTLTLTNFAKIIHFGALEKWPYRLLTFFNEKKIFFFENNCWGYAPTVVAVDQAYSTSNRHAEPFVRSSDNLVAFSQSWPITNGPGSQKKRKFVLSPSRSWKSWHDFLEYDCEHLWEAELKRLGVEQNGQFIFYALGAIEELPYLDFGGKKIFEVVEETLKLILQSTPKNYIIFLKPHPITNPSILNKILQRLQSNRVKISYLHPGLIGKKSKFAICSYYSTVMADCKNLGTPTIEYTNYANFAREITKNKSLRPEHVTHFISTKSPSSLKAVIKNISRNIQEPKSEKYSITSSYISNELLCALLKKEN